VWFSAGGNPGKPVVCTSSCCGGHCLRYSRACTGRSACAAWRARTSFCVPTRKMTSVARELPAGDRGDRGSPFRVFATSSRRSRPPPGLLPTCRGPRCIQASGSRRSAKRWASHGAVSSDTARPVGHQYGDRDGPVGDLARLQWRLGETTGSVQPHGYHAAGGRASGGKDLAVCMRRQCLAIASAPGTDRRRGRRNWVPITPATTASGLRYSPVGPR
jgi:hypothetical protein